MDCDCSCDIYDGPEFYDVKIVIARKQHECCECQGVINPGQKYERVTGRWEHEFSTFKTCIPCRSIRLDYCSGGWYYGGLAETIYECLGVEL